MSKNGNSTKSTSHSVDFKCASTTSGSDFTFKSDTTKNGTKKSFVPIDDTAYYKLYPGGKSPSLWVNTGAVSNQGSVSEDVEEYVSVVKSETAALSFEPSGTVSSEWTGDNEGSDTFTISGKTITFSKATTGVLKCSYTAQYDLLEITCSKTGKVLVIASTDDRSGSKMVDFTGSGTQRSTYLTVKDACSKEVLESVNVSIDKNDGNGYQFIGTTNSSGRLYLGELLTKKKYKLKMKKTDYQNSEDDTVKNDEFTVPEESSASG
ncbi:hypothetical protein [Candidatus Magnetomonas plexicatena]|uniref:hypothetical protein n=1 Tax=Candidatus Magnetomonas plexicatena TaxID=2552947 RepID=UPI001102F4B4|nr:hypothetical protein E2O03_014325 [Nitrospirales bacterium LBB_01]